MCGQYHTVCGTVRPFGCCRDALCLAFLCVEVLAWRALVLVMPWKGFLFLFVSNERCWQASLLDDDGSSDSNGSSNSSSNNNTT